MNLKQVEDIIQLFEKSKIKKLVVGDNELTVTLQKSQPVHIAPPAAPAPIAKTEAPVKATAPSNESVLKSNGVGFFRAKISHQDIKNNVKIKKNKPIFSITSMNLDHDQHADEDCVVLEYLVTNGEPVEYGQEIARIAWV